MVDSIYNQNNANK